MTAMDPTLAALARYEAAAMAFESYPAATIEDEKTAGYRKAESEALAAHAAFAAASAVSPAGAAAKRAGSSSRPTTT